MFNFRQYFRLGNTNPNSLLKKQSFIFIDLKKVYDHTWKYGILRPLWSWLKRKSNFLKSFFDLQKLKFKMGLSYLKSISRKRMYLRVILSVTLFTVKISNIFKLLPPKLVATFRFTLKYLVKGKTYVS